MTTIQSLPLTQLVPSKDNVRRTGTKAVESLIASIAAVGLINPLTVKAVAEGKYEVVAGAKRLAALKALAKKRKLFETQTVPCTIIEAEGATEISLAENVVREAMHPADEFEAFKKLAEDGQGIEDIAARFGTTPTVVKQRLKLAAVNPKLVKIYRDDGMTLEQLMAFTVSDDLAAQLRVWTATTHDWERRPSHIRENLTEKAIPASSKLARFVTVELYIASGGAILTDLFNKEESTYLTDPLLLDKLAAARLEREAHGVKGEGWNWVKAVPDFPWEESRKFEEEKGEEVPLSAKEAKRRAKLEAEIEELEELEERTDAQEDRYQELRDAPEPERQFIWSADDKARLGAVVTIDRDGAVTVIRGLRLRGATPDKAAAKPSKKAGPNADPDAAPDPLEDEGAGLSVALVEDLTAHRTAAWQATLCDRRVLALRAVTEALARTLCYGEYSPGALRISATQTSLNYCAKGIEDRESLKAMDAAAERWESRLPKEASELGNWLLHQTHDEVLDLLAFCAARTLDAVTRKNGAAPDPASLTWLGSQLEADMADWWQPTVESYFGRVSKGQILAALAEADKNRTDGAERINLEALSGLKKAELAKEAERLLKESRWVPAILR